MIDPRVLTALSLPLVLWIGTVTAMPGDRRRWWTPAAVIAASLWLWAGVLYRDWGIVASEVYLLGWNVYGLLSAYWPRRQMKLITQLPNLGRPW